MSGIADRLYALEAAQLPRDRIAMRWRMSQDVADACAESAGYIARSVVSGHTLVLGYPVVVDDTLPPDSLFVEQAPRKREPSTVLFETWATDDPEYRQFRSADEDRIRAALDIAVAARALLKKLMDLT
jgi:hypothetical protein